TKSLLYGENTLDADGYDFIMPAQKLFFSEKYDQILSYSNKYRYQDFLLYSVEAKENNQQPFFNDGTFGFDVVETIFFHISRFEEHYCDESQKDVHGRLNTADHFNVKNKLDKIPVVDHLVFCLLNAIGIEVKKLLTKYRMSFDIDIINRFSLKPPFRSTLKYGFVQPNGRSLRMVWLSYLKTLLGIAEDPYNNFEWLLQKNDQIEQFIYFLSGGLTKYDKPFPVINQEFVAIVRMAKERGIKVGIHPSYNSWNSFEVFKKEKEILENVLHEKINCSRQHFLHYSFKHTGNILEKLNIQEDSTMGYADRIGFRCGTGFPFHMYNFSEERPYHFLEVPMVVMDVGLMREGSHRWKNVIEIWERFLQTNKYYTFITFNFHNSRFFDASLDSIDLHSLYESIRTKFT
ncbi:MAG: hypothetical protein AAFZ15_31780, partial [Bacteroidota bacterium]